MGTTYEDEKALLYGISLGNEVAFRQLFLQYYNKLAGFILQLTGSKQLAEEILQDTFTKVWCTRERLDKINCFEAYLFRIAKNHCLNCMRQIAREQARKKRWEKDHAGPAYSPFPENGDDTLSLIEEGLEKLPPNQKKVYLLVCHEKLEQRKIAEQMNISIATVKKHQSLAMRFLKTYVRTHLKVTIVLLVDAFLK
jgi:RNA polymerase sigma-70 factor (family 1)